MCTIGVLLLIFDFFCKYQCRKREEDCVDQLNTRCQVNFNKTCFYYSMNSLQQCNMSVLDVTFSLGSLFSRLVSESPDFFITSGDIYLFRKI